MKYWLILAVSLSLSARVLAQDVVNLGATEYPPYSGVGLARGGLINQIVTEAYERVGYEVKIHFFPWARAARMAQDGELDGLAQVWLREARRSWLLYSDPVPSPNEMVFYKRKDTKIEFDNQNYLSLKPYTIGTGRGYANPPEFEKAQGQLRIEFVTEDIQNLQKLVSGRIDLVIIDKLVAQHLLRAQIPKALDTLNWISPALSIEQNHVGISKKASEFEKKHRDFNRGLLLLKQAGRIKAILAEHGFKD